MCFSLEEQNEMVRISGLVASESLKEDDEEKDERQHLFPDSLYTDKTKGKKEERQKDERKEDGNDNRPEISFEISTNLQSDDERKNKSDELEMKEKSSLMKK